MAPTKIRHCIIKESPRIRTFLKKRFEALDLKSKDVVSAMNKFNIPITEASLSRYLKGKSISNGLSQEAIIGLTRLYGIPVMLFVGKPLLNGTRLEFKLPEYDEKECLNEMKKFYKL